MSSVIIGRPEHTNVVFALSLLWKTVLKYLYESLNDYAEAKLTAFNQRVITAKWVA